MQLLQLYSYVTIFEGREDESSVKKVAATNEHAINRYRVRINCQVFGQQVRSERVRVKGTACARDKRQWN